MTGVPTGRLATAVGALLAALAMLTMPALAAPAPIPGLDGYEYTRWTPADGAPQTIGDMAQAPDGWLWLGTDDGLYRFDGVSFQHYAPAQQPAFAHRRVTSLHARANGDLYIGYFQHDVAILHPDGRFDVLPALPAAEDKGGTVKAVDSDGSIWTVGDAVHHFSAGRWTTIDRRMEWQASDLVSGLLDQDGRLWFANQSAVWRLDRAHGRLDKVWQSGGSLAQAPDGAVWLLAPPGGPAVRLAGSASGKPRPPGANAYTARVYGLIDATGTLWALNSPGMACIVRGATTHATPLEPRRDADACSDDGAPRAGQQGQQILEDREGNLWVASPGGLVRFRATRFQATGLAGDSMMLSVAIDRAGQAWAADRSDGTLWRLRPGQAAQREPWAHVQVLSSRPDGALLIGGKQTIWRRTGNGVETIPLPPGPDGKPVDHVMLGILDDGKVLWTTTLDNGLIGWVGGKWLARSAFDLPPNIYVSAAAGVGQMWLATAEDRGLVFRDGEKLTRYDGSAVGMATAMFPGTEFTVAGDHGFAVMKNGKLALLQADDPNVLRSVSGLAVTADGDRWLNGAAGVVHVRAADWHRALDRPSEPLRYELFGALDGYPGSASLRSRLHTAFTADGRHLWFIGTGGITGLDSADLRRNAVPPAPLILDLLTENARFTPSQAGTTLRLPPGSSSFRVQFTALSLRQPERVGFQYRLDGVDERWQDAGTRRSTSYTNVGPGDYMLRVRAVNEDGVASRADAVLPLTVAPTLVQSMPFRIACALAVLALATLLYRLRVAYLTRRLTERVTERLQVKIAERERIARTLHDTILQAVQALMLRLDALSSRLPEGDATRASLEIMLREAGSAIGAGRDQVRELRAAEVPSLEEIARAGAAELQALHPEVGFELRMGSAARDLLPAVADEAGHIVLEAMRNAFMHARARRVAVRIDHGRRTLVVTVADDGCGLDADVAHAGYRSGHWGLIGMRERATRIGGQLEIASRAGHGTTITLTVPAARAYAGRAA